MPDFTHLHVHTNFSILDGAAAIDSLIDKAEKSGMKALSITDHGNMFGVMKFIEEADKRKIKPIIGCEMYVAAQSRFKKDNKDDRSGYHLILLAKNLIGYKNLSRLSSLAFLEGFYYTPRIDKELLRLNKEGLIASSACLGGEIASRILEGRIDLAEEALKEYLEIFGDDFYIELMDHGVQDQKTVNEELIKIAKKFGVKLIATNDVHFIDAKDAEAHNILICLNTGKDITEQKSLVYTGQEYLKTQEEMLQVFSHIPEALENTNEIVEKIEHYSIKRPVVLPVFPLPEGFETELEYLSHLAFEGAKKRFPDLTEEIKVRLDYELSVIKKMGFPGYFLIVQDVINQARNLDVAVGPGRGSAAGSAVAYCIGITNVDPIKYNLLFERFLNPDRISMPDIDIDFDDEGRDRVIKYVIEKYGKDRVAQIVTFGTMAAKSSIRDVARVLKLPLPIADRLAKLVPETPGITLKKAFVEVRELANEKESEDLLIRKTLSLAEVLEGSARHTGVHACGMIIGPDDLINFIPLATAKDSDLMVTQYEGQWVEKVGMLKMDFLGLKTLSIMKDAIKNIYKRHQVQIDIEQIPYDDALTFSLFQKGNTIGIFQFESEGMRMYLKDLKPTDIEDLIAMNALYRPGPINNIPIFIQRKHGREKVEYLHPLLEEILKPTYGIMVYQEQIMKVAQVVAGYSLGSADILRKAMGKKQMKEMAKQEVIFIKGAQERGVPKDKAEEIFKFMEKFAEYGFNRSHSAAYSIIAYQTAYLKAHYPAEYMAAVLTHNLSDLKNISLYIEDCKRSKIQVLGPDVNESSFKFMVNKKGEVRFGLGAVKGVGENAAESLISERETNGIYNDFFDFIERINLRIVNKRSMEALAQAGAFDSFPDSHRAQYFFKEKTEEQNFIEKIIKHAAEIQNKKMMNQHSLFGEAETHSMNQLSMPVCERWSRLEQLEKEKEVAGFYLSGHPLDEYKIEMKYFCNTDINMLNENLMTFVKQKKEITFAGIVTSFVQRTTKSDTLFGNFVLEDYSGSIRLTLFSEPFLKWRHFIQETGQLLLIKAIVQNRNYNRNKESQQNEQLVPEIKITNISLLPESLDKMLKKVSVILPLSAIDKGFIKDINNQINENQGNCKVEFEIFSEEKSKIILCPTNGGMKVNSLFIKYLDESDIKFKLIGS